MLLIDGNTQPMTDAELVEFALRSERSGLVGIGAMTRMIAKAYRVADAMRAAGVPRGDGRAARYRSGRRSAWDATADRATPTPSRWARRTRLGRRSSTTRLAAQLKEIYTPVDAFGQERKPTLKDYPVIPWQSLDLDQFNLHSRVSSAPHACNTSGTGWETFHIIPIESGRGCPYGCEFCTVTGFFGDSIRFRTNQSIVERAAVAEGARREAQGQIAVFFVDDNFAINVKRTKSLLRDIIAAGAQLHWVGQISANLLRDEELVRPDRGIGRQVDLHRHGVA